MRATSKGQMQSEGLIEQVHNDRWDATGPGPHLLDSDGPNLLGLGLGVSVIRG